MRKILIAVMAAAIMGGYFSYAQNSPTNQVSTDTAYTRNLHVFNAITKYLVEAYVDSMRPDAAFEAAIAAMLNTVDPYTEYYNPDEKERLEMMTTGAYGGIGAYIMSRGKDTYISMPMEGTPSYKAGLKAGDRIIMVDSMVMTGKPSDQVTKYLKGDPGTVVNVTVNRPYVADSILTFSIMRERVQDKSVPFYGVVNGDIGYVKLTQFIEKSAKEVKDALESFKKNPEIKGVVLDLRDNGGGLVESAVNILGMFLPRGTKVVEIKGHDADSYKAYTTPASPLLPDMPLVVLIDDGSASASEITAGALQDLDRAVLVGQRSFGKGLVQSTLQLPYDGLLKITTAKYHLPSGRLIQALDYSRRNPDGTVARTPDSLTNKFLTRNGRTVRDGGGLVPDSVVKVPEYSRLLYNLMLENQLFDYATKYAATHPSIPQPKDFKVTDEIYADFVVFVDTAKIKSDKTGQRLLEELRKTADTEGFMTDQLKEELDALSLLLVPDLKRDLYNRKDEISRFLGREIVGRYYYRSGEEEFMLYSDDEMAVARDILTNDKLYNKILNKKGSGGSGKAAKQTSGKTSKRKKK